MGKTWLRHPSVMAVGCHSQHKIPMIGISIGCSWIFEKKLTRKARLSWQSNLVRHVPCPRRLRERLLPLVQCHWLSVTGWVPLVEQRTADCVPNYATIHMKLYLQTSAGALCRQISTLELKPPSLDFNLLNCNAETMPSSTSTDGIQKAVDAERDSDNLEKFLENNAKMVYYEGETKLKHLDVFPWICKRDLTDGLFGVSRWKPWAL